LIPFSKREKSLKGKKVKEKKKNTASGGGSLQAIKRGPEEKFEMRSIVQREGNTGKKFEHGFSKGERGEGI